MSYDFMGLEDFLPDDSYDVSATNWLSLVEELEVVQQQQNLLPNWARTKLQSLSLMR
jgi:hypothetical protein